MTILGLNILFICCVIAFHELISLRQERLYAFIQHLASMARRGLPIHAGLRLLGQDMRGFFGTRVALVARKVEDGGTLGDAMDAFPHTFPPVMRGMVRLGEESGNLAGFLDELRQGYRRVIEEPGQAVTAFIYPLAVTVFTNIMLGALFLGVLPRFRIIADQMGLGYVDPSRPLFLASQLLLGGCVLAAMIMMTGGSAVHFGVSPVRFAKGLVDRLLLWTPLFSGLVKNAALHQFCTAAGLMARAGAALPEAATTAASGERNVVLRARLTRLAGRLAEGAAPGEAFRGEGWMPPAVSWFVEAGASSRDLGENLLAAGAHFQAKWLFLRQMAMRAIVPVLILLNGLLVLMTMLAVFGPIVRVVGVFTAR